MLSSISIATWSDIQTPGTGKGTGGHCNTYWWHDRCSCKAHKLILLTYVSFDKPRQGIDVPFPSFKGDVLVEVERNIPRGCLLRIKICLKKKRGLFNKRLQRISTSTTLIFNWTFAPPVQPFESNQLQSGVAWPILFIYQSFWAKLKH